ncbi:MAG: hypothetical protein JOZ87_35510 [Chloroflexi bacterium]|nr:hypothetical protein [Chloroflexota bacterium]
MSLTAVLAIIGAVTGVCGAVLGGMAFVRDRAKLLIRHRLYYRRGSAELSLFVMNVGRQPVAILEVGLREARLRPALWRFRREWFIIGLGESTAGFARWSMPVLHFTTDDPLVLKPGDIRKFVMEAEDYDDEEPALRVPIYAYAEDALGRVAARKVKVAGTAESWKVTGQPTSKS